MLLSYVPFGVTVMVLGCPDYLQPGINGRMASNFIVQSCKLVVEIGHQYFHNFLAGARASTESSQASRETSYVHILTTLS